jgi:4-hydroxybenzoate polyprenyltransferase
MKNSGFYYLIKKIAQYFEMIKFEHTIFALPFALGGMLLANSNKWPDFLTFMWVITVMVSGRTAAMALNRSFDAEIDKKNPRTSTRAIPAGKINKSSAFILSLICFGIMGFATWQLPLICKQLLPFAIFILVVYSFTKRFTHFSHFVLGCAIGAAAAGGWLAVSEKITLPVVLWGFAVIFWVAGFDIIYALQDVDFDRKNKLFSIPAWLGIKKSLFISKITHLFTLLLLLCLGFLIKIGIFYWFGIVFTGFMLVYEHSLIKDNDLTNINAAFFNVNGYVSVGIFCFLLLDKLFNTGVLRF